MKSVHNTDTGKIRRFRMAAGLLLALLARGPVTPTLNAARNIVLWDAGAPWGKDEGAPPRAGWRAVPSELFVFEADPLKAASDPGYYGLEYAFRGDAVVENRFFIAVFSAARGRVLFCAKTPPAPPEPTIPPAWGNKILEFVPSAPPAASGKIRRCEILRNVADEVLLKVTFTGADAKTAEAVFAFGRDPVVGVQPGEGLARCQWRGAIARGVAPAFIGDDLIFNPADYPSTTTLAVPAQNVFLGLLRGENSEALLSWPPGKQRLRLRLAAAASGPAEIESLDFAPAGQPFYLAILSAPGIWHREVLRPAFLEKDVAANWRPPFPARWKTQLNEGGVQTTFAFRHVKGSVWRAVVGSYTYPVWFDQGRAFYHLSKKVPPRGESIIYFLEGENTPLEVLPPAEILKMTLGRPLAATLRDVAGRKLRTHHRRGGAGVHRACTCGCTEAIQSVFAKGLEQAQREYIAGALEDMNFFVQQHVARIEQYRRFAEETARLLRARAAVHPQEKALCDQLEPIARQILEEYEVQKDNMKSLAHAADLTRQTLALTTRSAADNRQAYDKLLHAWRAMGGAQDYVLGQCHVIARKLFQAAGYGAATHPEAFEVATEVMARCRQVLRNPDGYEVWAEY